MKDLTFYDCGEPYEPTDMDKKERDIQIKLVEQIVAEYKALVSGEIETRGNGEDCSLCKHTEDNCNKCIYVVITGYTCFCKKMYRNREDQDIPYYSNKLRDRTQARLTYLETVFLPMAREWDPDETIQKGDI